MIMYIVLASTIILIDRVTKYYVIHHQSISSFLGIDIEPSINRGLSWSIFSSQHDGVFYCVSSIAFIFFSLFCLYTFKRYQQHHSIWAEIMIIAGACSNLIDRYVYQGVVDFISIQTVYFCWPSFNIADSAICLGAVIIMLSIVFEKQ